MKKRLERIIERVLNTYAASFLMEEDRKRLTKHLSEAIMKQFFVASYDSQSTFE